MNFIAQNRTENVTVAVAEQWIAKKKALGLPFGRLCVQAVGGGDAPLYPIEDLPEGEELDPKTAYYIMVEFPVGRYLTVATAMTQERIIIEPQTAFMALCDMMDLDETNQMLNIPEVRKALSKALRG